MNIFITGGSYGLGYELSKIFADSGNDVYTLSRSGTGYKKNKLNIKLDLEDQENINFILFKYLEGIKFDLLILNAGILGKISKLEKLTYEDFEQIFKINFYSNKIILDYFLKKSGIEFKVIGISSGASLKAYDGWALYCTSKAAFKQLISTYAQEFENVKFLNIAPGIIKTNMQFQIKNYNPKEFKSLKKFHNLFENMSSPKDIAKSLFQNLNYLFSFESGSYIDLRDLKSNDS